MASDDAIGSFAQDGVAVIRSVIQRDQLESLSEDISKIRGNLAETNAAAGTAGSSDAVLNWQACKSFEEAALGSSMSSHAADFLDSFKIRFLFDRVLLAASDRLEKWQQLQPFSGVDGRSITAWLAVETINKQESPQFWAGSHLGTWYLPAEIVDAAEPPAGVAVKAIPDLVNEQSSYDIRRWALEPGDVVYASSLTVHSLPSPLASREFVAFNYADAGAVWAERTWPTAPDLALVGGGAVKAGQPLDTEQFPLAWPQP